MAADDRVGSFARIYTDGAFDIARQRGTAASRYRCHRGFGQRDCADAVTVSRDIYARRKSFEGDSRIAIGPFSLGLGASRGKPGNEGSPVFRYAVDRGKQFVHARDHCDLWPLSDSAQAPVISAQPRIETNRNQNRHP